jgi:DNA-binding NarL/FixJ family response regulator
VLLVEDDFVVAADLEHELRAAGFEVVGVATTAEKAVELARGTKPALAIMDVRLAGRRDGVDTALELFRELNIRSLFATAHSDPATRARAEAASPLGWLAKPYSARLLIDAIHRVLNS